MVEVRVVEFCFLDWRRRSMLLMGPLLLYCYDRRGRRSRGGDVEVQIFSASVNQVVLAPQTDVITFNR